MKDSNRISGTARTICPFFEEIDAILGTRASSSPVVLLESSTASPSIIDLSSSKYILIILIGLKLTT